MTPVMRQALRYSAVLRDVEQRLTEGGGVIELHQFHRFSASEVDVLLWLERNAPLNPQAVVTSDPQVSDGTVAA